MRARASIVCVSLVLGCYASVDDGDDEIGDTGEIGDGDGDGDVTGDGDGDSSGDGDGDGDSSSGDGDGDTTTGDGDSTTGDSTTGDGDSTTTSGDGDGDSTTGGPEGCTDDGAELINLVNEYRAENGLPPIPASPSMCIVSTTHVHDLVDNNPVGGNCNLHSWSDQGSWSPCCYTPDHAQAQCMWDKPTELSNYPGYGYENAAAGVGSPAQALEAWKSSPPHNEVILNQGIWTTPWQALGADVYNGYSVLWFGQEVDPG